MAAVVSIVNSASESLDPIVSVAGTEYLKEAIVPRAAAGQDELVAAQRIATLRSAPPRAAAQRSATQRKYRYHHMKPQTTEGVYLGAN